MYSGIFGIYSGILGNFGGFEDISVFWVEVPLVSWGVRVSFHPSVDLTPSL